MIVFAVLLVLIALAIAAVLNEAGRFLLPAVNRTAQLAPVSTTSIPTQR